MASVVQTGTNAGSGDLAIAMGSSVTAGNLLIALITQTSAAVRTYNVTDSLGNTWVQLQRADHAGSRFCEIWYAKNIAGGACTVTSAQSGGAVKQQFSVVEAAGCDIAAPAEDSDQIIEAANTSTHFCAPSTDIDTASTGGILISGGCLSASGTTLTEKSGWTLLQSGTNFLHQCKIYSGGALTDERGEYTSVTARQGPQAIAAFKDAATGGGKPWLDYQRQMAG